MSSERRIVEIPVEKKIERILRHKGLTVTTAESCTGGLVAGNLINAAGISEVFKEGYITYSNEAKVKILGVKEETLEKYGAVSRETAQEMAEGAAKTAGTEVALAVTGIAGPDGGTEEKPVGLVYIACTVNGDTIVKRCYYGGDRNAIRQSAAKEALDILYCQILTSEEPAVAVSEEEPAEQL
ncbi:MAG: nicotinamide-nucleotide amidohydrolase family protein [Clostridiales bacterium]|nr:nicotinamide-nucleotide amidohydrolase family protein [Clostridiales bacterium]